MGNRITALILSALLSIAAYATAPDTIPMRWFPGDEFADTTVSKFRIDTLNRVGHNLVHLIRRLSDTPGWRRYRNLCLRYWDGEFVLDFFGASPDHIGLIRQTFAGITHIDNPHLNIYVSVHSDTDNILPRILVPDGTSFLTTGMTLEQQRRVTKDDSIANNGQKSVFLPNFVYNEFETTGFQGRFDLENGWIMPLEICLDGSFFFTIPSDGTVGTLWCLAYRDWGLNIPENYNQLFHEYFQTHGTKVEYRRGW